MYWRSYDFSSSTNTTSYYFWTPTPWSRGEWMAYSRILQLECRETRKTHQDRKSWQMKVLNRKHTYSLAMQALVDTTTRTQLLRVTISMPVVWSSGLQRTCSTTIWHWPRYQIVTQAERPSRASGRTPIGEVGICHGHNYIIAGMWIGSRGQTTRTRLRACIPSTGSWTTTSGWEILLWRLDGRWLDTGRGETKQQKSDKGSGRTRSSGVQQL